ncbi:helix-turn-helix transcriptional regulator [Isoptericola cucumis]|uniref:HTH luxR-type domain-containing protein n=1 Tax=Isoptericola cucumis TaxID=1776856 RepID=A0ABQ2B486_9MICO|nr:LuxR family transcriptional regulator [Isoptericola cucumis]GGI05714.1 hypothetical protein GCM10007368_07550 [Isoptericola cucumis]
MAGRDAFRTDLRDEIVDHLVAGSSVDLIGQKGSGRSMLVADATSGLVERGWDVVRVQGIATLKDRPLEALAVADLARRGDHRGESAVTTAVRLVEKAVDDGRTVLVVDDVDDLDQASAGAVTAAHARRAFPLLTASRPRPERSADPYALPSEVRPGVQLTVPVLDYVDVSALLGAVLPGEVDPEVVTRINRSSGGLPGLVVAVAEAARRSGRLRQVNGTWVAGPDLWSPGLTRVVQPLIADLDPDGVEAVQILSLAGAVDLPTAVELVGWQALEDLDACQLLRFVPQGDGVVVGIYPPLVEERYRHLPLGARRLRFADRMTQLLDPGARTEPEERERSTVAQWFEPVVDASAVPTEEPGRAGLSDTVLNRLTADEQRRQLLLRRHEWERHPSPRTAAHYLRALLIGNGSIEAMHEVVDGTPPSDDPAEMAAFYRWRAHALATADDDPDAARALLRRAGGEVGPWSGLLHAVEDHLTLVYDRVPAWREWPATSDPVWSRTREFSSTVDAEHLLATGRPEAAAALLSATEWTDPDFATRSRVLTGLAMLVDGDVHGALTWSSAHLERARAHVDVEAVPGHAFVALSALLLLGRTRELRRLLGSVLAIGLGSALQRHYLAAILEVAAAVARRDGHVTSSAMLAGQAERTSRRGAALLPSVSWVPRTDGADGVDPEQGWEAVLDLLERGYLVSAAVRAGDLIDVAPDPERVATLRGAVGPEPAGLVETIVQVAEATVDEDVMAGATLGRRLADAGQVTLGVRAARATVRRLRAEDRNAEARAVQQDVDRALRRAGVDPDALLDPLPGATLTAREQEVGTLVADGLANGEIARALGISVKTVENHLNRLLHKLGVTDRSGVRAALRG